MTGREWFAVFEAVAMIGMTIVLIFWRRKQNAKPSYPRAFGNFTEIGPECFTYGNVISYKGENFYRACGAWVCDNLEGGASFCVKRAGHPGDLHESYTGVLRLEEHAR
jgi:hypothetical protein